jgi:hypothetical protein
MVYRRFLVVPFVLALGTTFTDAFTTQTRSFVKKVSENDAIWSSSVDALQDTTSTSSMERRIGDHLDRLRDRNHTHSVCCSLFFL